MKYVFHPEALAEYADAVQHYKKQRTELAQAFINSIEDAVYQIKEYPTRYLVINEDMRRCMTRKFPYMILYTVEQDYILILAVTHCSREPGYWKSRK
ncbi:type II toxin-antitoxin system RelE/ParE family toxin [Chlorogloea sp. CCALA 695]|uniref:type II toxin-antitoxin system RelE/ParE family toxin n=1 Tax=Chlorogloea sp. CCALA 695 TaxID=2107693 RepID=UPI000D0605E0|nr:type II toxin-antitoxin system RelE/ParE family toxin [Chlorogloea sp. CCALA 695]PSB29694.1 plasmid stabilization protein [Chlorogloea sp. CCALA 695]